MNWFKRHYLKILFSVSLVGSLVAVLQARNVFVKEIEALPNTMSMSKVLLIDGDVTQSIDKAVFFGSDGQYRYKVTTPPSFSGKFGDCIYVSGRVSRPENRQDAEVLHAFPYIEYLAKDRVYLLLNVKKFETSINCPELSPYQKVQRLFMKHKEVLVSAVLQEYERPHSGLVAGVLIAGKGLMDKHSLELFKRTSLSHVVVLSGSNVSLILVCIKMLVDALFFWKRKEGVAILWTKKIIILGAVWAFVLLTGGGAPIYRAAASAFCGMILFTKQTSQVYALTVVIFILTIISPFQTLYDPSFHLTCCATFGLILCSKYLNEKLQFSVFRFLPKWLREIIAITLATQVFVFPYLIFVTSSFSSVFLLSNILVLPMIPFIMLFGFVTMIGSLIGISWLVDLSVWMNTFLLKFVFLIVELLAKVPGGYVELKMSTSILVLISYFLFLTIFIYISPPQPPNSN